jgi:GGDEF domain-containing protein
VTFEIYFLAIIAASLRDDERICIGVGLLAGAQYAAHLDRFKNINDTFGDAAVDRVLVEVDARLARERLHSHDEEESCRSGFSPTTTTESGCKESG